VKLTRSGSNFSGYYSTDGINWTQIGSTQTISAIPPTALAGLAVTAHTSTAVLSTATFTNVSVVPTGWSDNDLGSPPAAGSGSYSNGTWTVAGSGADIGGTSDQLNFASESYSGDGSVIAYIASQTRTDAQAKAGVMFRDSFDANGAYASVLVTPNFGINFQWRTADGASGAYDSTWPSLITAPIWVKLTRSGSTFSGYYSTNGITWTQVGSTQTISAIPTAAVVGLAVTAHTSSSVLSTATFTNVTVGPPGWTDTDIGSPPVAGSASYSGGTWTVAGSGVDIWDPADQFNFASQSYSGDGLIVSYVASQTNTNGWAKAGLMFRDSLVANGARVSIFATPSNGVSFQWRSTDGGTSNYSSTSTSITVPVWLELTRSGSNFSGYYSTDGITWTQVGSTETISAIPTAALVGMAVTAHTSSAVLSTATFDNVIIEP
jgi:regulation of enolase protein 1 (concanavalin A-like superfamily)